MSWVQSIKEWAKRLKKQIIMLWFASRHPQMPWLPKIIAVVAVAYAFSPIDLIPDFILMNPLMILVKIIKLRWIHILSYDQMVSRKINNQTTRCANSIF
ncbi:YkvA family protein, partial [Acinetobacter baumannii]|uniref:YkvA family protein n=1 Tax=Acinetobacter baumannii TaxID=470 RepID=UPI00301BF276